MVLQDYQDLEVTLTSCLKDARGTFDAVDRALAESHSVLGTKRDVNVHSYSVPLRLWHTAVEAVQWLYNKWSQERRHYLLAFLTAQMRRLGWSEAAPPLEA